MRLWSLSPRYLDPTGLVALWREALLAQKVLSGGTRGYRNHPQLVRFLAHPHAAAAIGSYLRAVLAEADRRKYRFDASRIQAAEEVVQPISVTNGQLLFERGHLIRKLDRCADPSFRDTLIATEMPDPHPSFFVEAGPKAAWERG